MVAQSTIGRNAAAANRDDAEAANIRSNTFEPEFNKARAEASKAVDEALAKKEIESAAALKSERLLNDLNNTLLSLTLDARVEETKALADTAKEELNQLRIQGTYLERMVKARILVLDTQSALNESLSGLASANEAGQRINNLDLANELSRNWDKRFDVEIPNPQYEKNLRSSNPITRGNPGPKMFKVSMSLKDFYDKTAINQANASEFLPEEDRLADKKFGSTRRGISPAYSDKYMKKALRMGELADRDALKARLADILEWKNLFIVNGYHHDPIDLDEMMDWLDTYAMPFKDYVCDTTDYLTDAIEDNKSLLFEAQLGALRDIDYGIYPYTSGSSTIAAYAPIGAGIPEARLDTIIGIMKAYSTCVGEGPFTCEMFGDEAAALRDAGGEYGAATGRPRRVGGFDVVASRYGVKMQGCTSIALTKLDVLSYLDKIPVCVAYDIDGERVDRFPIGVKLAKAKPIYEYLPGFHCDISGCRTISDLPKEALDYVHYLEAAVGCRIKYVSVGPDRDAYIKMF